MSQSKQPTDAADDATELREMTDQLDAIARAHGGTVDDVLRDMQHGLETVADVLEEEDGEMSRDELAARLFPRGGRR